MEKILIVSESEENRAVRILDEMVKQGFLKKYYDDKKKEFVYQSVPDVIEKIKIAYDGTKT